MLKNSIDYYLYIFKIKKLEVIVFILDCILFLISTYSVLNEWPSIFNQEYKNWGFIIIIWGSILKFIYDLYKMIDEIKQNLDLRYGDLLPGKVDLNDVKVELHDIERYNYKIIDCKINSSKIEKVINSETIDDYLKHADLKLEENPNMEKQIFQFIKKNSQNLLPFLKWQYRLSVFYGKMFFNQKKLCLSKDLNIKDNIVTCHKGTYYDTFLTNIINGKQLRSNQDNSIIASAEDYLPIKFNDNEIFMKDITSSLVNNEIGISTIAITSDNYLVIWTQNRAAQSSNGLLVPTGSGSCDWSDKVGNNFSETIKSAMKRELWEESGAKSLCKKYEDIGETIILGYFRWIAKAGKPEFVGLTRVKSDLISFCEDRREVFGRQEYYISTIDDIKKVIEKIRENDNISVPLSMNLLCLEKYYEKNRDELAKFIGLENIKNIEGKGVQNED